MAEDLKIVVGTEVKVDKAQLQKDLDTAVKGMRNKVENVKVKVDFVDIESKARAAINRAQNVFNKTNLKIKVGIDDASLKGSANALKNQLQQQQKSTASAAKSQAQLNREQEKSLRFITQQTKALNDLESKAFKRNNSLTGQNAKDIEAQFKKLRAALNSIDEQTTTQTREAIKV